MSNFNITKELGKVMEYVAKTATAIRMHSAYRRQGSMPEEPTAQFDLLWLSDSLHNFDYLGSAIQSGQSETVVQACDELIEMYKRYGVDSSGFDSKAAFERAQEYGISLDEMVDVFISIRSKAIASVQ
jgi:hypothetical protein